MYGLLPYHPRTPPPDVSSKFDQNLFITLSVILRTNQRYRKHNLLGGGNYGIVIKKDLMQTKIWLKQDK